MASKTDIVNRALSKLGETRTSNVDNEDTKKARVMSYMWDQILDATLAAYPWNFAVKRRSLAKDAQAPDWGFNNAYTLPSDFLTLIEINNNPEYRLEGGKILTNEKAPLKIKYIFRETNTGNFEPLFSEVLATRLAYEACEELTQSNTKKQILAQELQERIREAYASDSIQNQPVERPDDEWLTSREFFFDEIDYNSG